MNLECLLDMDGCLVEFVQSAIDHHKMDIQIADARWNFWAQVGMSDKDFWAPLGHDFWASLPWTTEGKTLLCEVENIFGPDVTIMTVPGDTPGGVEGKLAWIRRHLSNYSSKYLMGPPKHVAAGPRQILIDDHDENIDAFAAKGGMTVLVPRPWNRRRAETDNRGRFDLIKLIDEIERTIKNGSHNRHGRSLGSTDSATGPGADLPAR